MKYLEHMIASAVVMEGVLALNGNDGTCMVEDCKAYLDYMCTKPMQDVPWQYMQHAADTMNTAIHRTYPWDKCHQKILFYTVCPGNWIYVSG